MSSILFALQLLLLIKTCAAKGPASSVTSEFCIRSGGKIWHTPADDSVVCVYKVQNEKRQLDLTPDHGEPNRVPDGSLMPSILPPGYGESDRLPDGNILPPFLPSNYGKPPTLPEESMMPPVLPPDYGKPHWLPEGSMTPQVLPPNYGKPHWLPEGSMTPPVLPPDYGEPPKLPEGSMMPPVLSPDYDEPPRLPEGSMTPPYLPPDRGESTGLSDRSLMPSVLPPDHDGLPNGITMPPSLHHGGLQDGSTMPPNLPPDHGGLPDGITVPPNLPPDHGELPEGSTMPPNLPPDHGGLPDGITMPPNLPPDHGGLPDGITMPPSLPPDYGGLPDGITLPPNLHPDHGELPEGSTMPPNLPSNRSELPEGSTMPPNLPPDRGGLREGSTMSPNLPPDHGGLREGSTMPLNLHPGYDDAPKTPNRTMLPPNSNGANAEAFSPSWEGTSASPDGTNAGAFSSPWDGTSALPAPGYVDVPKLPNRIIMEILPPSPTPGYVDVPKLPNRIIMEILPPSPNGANAGAFSPPWGGTSAIPESHSQTLSPTSPPRTYPSNPDHSTEEDTEVTKPPVGPMSTACRAQVMYLHNLYRILLAEGLIRNGKRGKPNLPKAANLYRMRYDMDLEAEAQRYANTCPTAPSSVSSRPNSGENFEIVYKVSSCEFLIPEVLESWWSQIAYSGMNIKVPYNDFLDSEPAPSKFTQMGWAATYKVGCAMKVCGHVTVVVCRYRPRGNIPNEYVYRRGNPCADCSSTCKEGLCNAPA
ncbi:unnamed protein product [Cylicocyclus nassatus]|uniref:SCP domain-containing protein n=1 Tax=Cylicocyclus nassatus TaxID=53992 RepID=A0AA36DLN2_CYLNA|nr:unnamed protein product [Cylicocyclus nassatus]